MSTAAGRRPRLDPRGWAPERTLDASTAAGVGCWIAFLLAGPESIERLLALAPLVLVPLGLRLSATPTRDGRHALAYRLAAPTTLPAGVLAVVALSLPAGPVAGLLALPWLAVTLAVALFGAWRLLPRGPLPLCELVIDAGLAYVAVGGGWLAIHRFGIAPLGFGGTIALLTAVHFHYAGFVLALFTGFAGRVREDGRGATWSPFLAGAYRASAAVVAVGPGLIGLGIAFSPVVEIAAVTVFTLAVTVLGVVVVLAVVPALSRPSQRGLVAVAALVLPVSMAFALAYGWSTFSGTAVGGLDVATMVALHGHLNALGFAPAALVGWRVAIPGAPVSDPGVPFSEVVAGGRVGADFPRRRGLVGDGDPAGQVAAFGTYASPTFDPEAVHPAVRRFYERTAAYELAATVTWHRPFRTAGAVFARLTARIEQLALPGPNVSTRRMVGRILPVAEGADGRGAVRAWIRTDPDDERAYFVALYATHGHAATRYMNVALPLPGANVTGVLRPERLSVGKDGGSADGGPAGLDADGAVPTDTDPDAVGAETAPVVDDADTDRGVDGTDGVRFTSRRRSPEDDAGLYLVTPLVAIRLPIHEEFRVRPARGRATSAGLSPTAPTPLSARHRMWLFGMPLLTIEYAIESAGDRTDPAAGSA